MSRLTVQELQSAVELNKANCDDIKLRLEAARSNEGRISRQLEDSMGSLVHVAADIGSLELALHAARDDLMIAKNKEAVEGLSKVKPSCADLEERVGLFKNDILSQSARLYSLRVKVGAQEQALNTQREVIATLELDALRFQNLLQAAEVALEQAKTAVSVAALVASRLPEAAGAAAAVEVEGASPSLLAVRKV